MSLVAFHDDFPVLCDRLLNMRRNNRMGHAYLLVGDDPEFLERFARGWIRVCACKAPLASGDACGECAPCQQFETGRYPELQVLQPRSKSRKILIEEIRDFEHQLKLTAAPDRLKAGLIVEADRLNEQSQNAFLKTLEEPPQRTMLILVTTQPQGLLPTIRSRCQIISLLQNRRSYDFALQHGLVPMLARLHRGAGAAVALATAQEICELLSALQAQAEHLVGIHDEDDPSLADQDATFIKRLETMRQARVQAEYLRLRQQVMEAIEVWFLQQCLLASRVPVHNLPHPEFLKAVDNTPAVATPASWAEADENAAHAADLARYLAANVEERLAVEAFCLTICKKVSN